MWINSVMIREAKIDKNPVAVLAIVRRHGVKLKHKTEIRKRKPREYRFGGTEFWCPVTYFDLDDAINIWNERSKMPVESPYVERSIQEYIGIFNQLKEYYTIDI